ncbi:MAG: DUF3187 family protein [Proteobacteria bacterium]|nr:DUF3187 family protein [Pseudomonadota bacterium]
MQARSFWSVLSSSFYVFSMTTPIHAQDGPLMVRSQSIGQLFRLNPPLPHAALLDPGTIDFSVSRTYANLWARDKRFVIDGEVIDDQAHFGYGLAKSIQVGLGFSTRLFAQANTDQAAISFHQLLNIGQDGRLEAGKHHSHFAIPDYSLEFTGYELDQAFSEQTVLDLNYALLEARDWGFDLSLTGLLSYEMADLSPYFRGAMDRGWQLSLRLPEGLWSYFGNFTQLYYDHKKAVNVATNLQEWGFAGGLSYQLPEQQYLIWQLMVNRPVFRDIGQLSRNSYEWQLGYRYHWEAVSLEIAVLENIFWLYNSPDWGFSLGLRTSL